MVQRQEVGMRLVQGPFGAEADLDLDDVGDNACFWDGRMCCTDCIVAGEEGKSVQAEVGLSGFDRERFVGVDQ